MCLLPIGFTGQGNTFVIAFQHTCDMVSSYHDIPLLGFIRVSIVDFGVRAVVCVRVCYVRNCISFTVPVTPV